MKQNKSINIHDLDKDYLQMHGYKYALIYFLNDLYFGDIEDLDEINKDIIVEAYFFNASKELHFFEDNDFIGIVTEDDGQDEGFAEEYLLKRRLGNNLRKNDYKKLKTFNYVDYEDDGQAFIKYTALKGVK